MGYTTDFEGRFDLDRPLDGKTLAFLRELNRTRRMKRDVSKLPATGFEKYGFDSWGPEGAYFVDSPDDSGLDSHVSSVLNVNREPEGQPGLWCKWVPTEDDAGIEWDGGEKFYSYVEWLEWIITEVLAPRGYVLSGTVEYQGEEPDDFGKIIVEDNNVRRVAGRRVYDE